MNINSICVCGAGTMGSGIAQAAAQSGFYVILFEKNQSALAKAIINVEKNLQALVEKGKLAPGEPQKIMQYIRFTDDIE
ncbi:MAG TPA: 3-hydroxyacyl-CoA dehydrogenase NAD-binding domain-containing protein, partial [Chitinophagaceae bacterium]|nr:3-hydroxyacyl-CoA dehydrogenase NAD-binding domain-containing protein [Chitinophagaceae bacterium]